MKTFPHSVITKVAIAICLFLFLSFIGTKSFAQATISSPSQVGTTFIPIGGTNYVLSQFQIVTGATAVGPFTALTEAYSANTIVAGDVSGATPISLYVNTVNSLTSGTPTLLKSIAFPAGTTGSLAFSAFSQTLTASKTYFFFITMNLTAAATAAHVITVSATAAGGGGFTFTAGTKSGNITVTGIQTISPMAGVYFIPAAYGTPNFASIAAAISSLNTNAAKLPVGGVTFKVQPGWVENFTNFQGTITATGTAAIPIIFKNGISAPVMGAGGDPKITMTSAGTGSTATARDAIIVLKAASFVTFDGIDLADGNTSTATTEFELGYALFPTSATKGAQHDTIRNCKITLNNNAVDVNSVGIYSNANFTSTAGSNALVANTATNATGSNSFNSFYGNTISNAYSGISLIGYSGTTMGFEDQNNSVGLAPNGSASGNTISGLGGSSTAYYGILTDYQSGSASSVIGGTLRIAYNIIRATSAGTGTYAGIQIGSVLSNDCQNANINVYGNTITPAASAGGGGFGIYLFSGAVLPTTAWAGPTIRVSGNIFTANAGNTNWGGIKFISTAQTNGITYNNLLVDSNTITGGCSNFSGGIVLGYVNGSAAVNTIGKDWVIGNKINNISNSPNSGNIIGMYLNNSSSVGTVFNYTNNCIHDISTGNGSRFVIMSLTNVPSNASAVRSVRLDTIYNCTNNGGPVVYGIFASGGAFATTGIDKIDSNLIHDLGATTTSQAAYGIYYNCSTSNYKLITRNRIYSIAAGGSNIAAGIFLTLPPVFGSSTVNGTDSIYLNKIYDISSSTISGSTGGSVFGIQTGEGLGLSYVFNNYIGLGGNPSLPTAPFAVSVAGTPSVYGINAGGTSNNLYYNTVYLTGSSTGSVFGTAALSCAGGAITAKNNLFINNFTANGVGGQTVAFQNNGGTITGSNNNIYWAGTPSASNLIYYNGTLAAQDLGTYETAAGYPNESKSLSGNPTFLNTTDGTNKWFLHIDSTVTQLDESAGTPITSPPTTIKRDFDGQTRNSSTPDIGADEYTTTAAAPTNMIPVSAAVSQVTGRIYAITTNNKVIRIKVVTQNTGNPISATGFSLNANGTSVIGDISNAKIYYTGADSTFNTNTLFGGPVVPTISPNFTISGSQQLLSGAPNNYFWLTYDAPATFISCTNLVDAECSSVTFSSGGPITPVPSAPAGALTEQACLGGTYTIDNTLPQSCSNFPSFTSAITALNASSLCANVTFNVAAGETFNESNLIITERSTTYTATFQNSGGADPVILAAPGTGDTDGVVIFKGANGITFNGIDLQENPANTTATTQMEWGYALLKDNTSGVIGSQNITIENCTITLNNTNVATVGIYGANTTRASTTQLTATSVGGTNSNNRFFGNTISNVYTGISLNGFKDPNSPYNYFDQNNSVGVTAANTLTNFGGGANQASGIAGTYQNNFTVSNNIITGGTGTTGNLYGVGLPNATGWNNSTVTVNNNTVSLTSGSGGSVVSGIDIDMGENSTTNTATITGNVLQNFSLGAGVNYYGIDVPAGSVSGTLTVMNNTISGGTQTGNLSNFGFIYLQSNPTTATLTGNNIYSNTLSGGTNYGINVGNGTASPTGTWTISNNNVYSNTLTGNFSAVALNATPANTTVTWNNIYSNTISASSINYGIVENGGGGTGTWSISNNNIYLNNMPSSDFSFIWLNANPVNVMVTANNIYSNAFGTSSGYGIYVGDNVDATGIWKISSNNIYSNNLSGDFYSILLFDHAPAFSCFSNQVYSNNISANGTFWGIYSYGVSTGDIGIGGLTIDSIYNNSIHNITNTGVGAVNGIVLFAAPDLFGTLNNTNSSRSVYQNNIYTLVSANNIDGIYDETSSIVPVNDNIYKNNLYDFSTTGTAAQMWGMFLNPSGGDDVTNINVYNNMICNLRAPVASGGGFSVIFGMFLQDRGLDNDTIKAFYNSIFLNASSSSSGDFGTTGIYTATTTTTTLKDNLVVNTSTASNGGLTIAQQRNGDDVTLLTADYNDYYAGNPSSFSNLIYYDAQGPDNFQNLSDYQSFSGMEANSISVDPGFTSANDLHAANMTNSAGLESLGVSLAGIGINDDIDGDIRAQSPGYAGTGTAPDIGADEFGGPTAYDVTGGTNCGTTTVGLNNSKTGVTYTLRLNGVDQTPTKAGNNGAISFGAQTTTGTYTVVGVDGFNNSTTMIGNAVVNASPTVYSVTGGAANCGSATVGLSNSQDNTFDYQLNLNGSNQGSAINGSSGAFNFGTQSSVGTYTVVATSSLGCTATMSGNAIISTAPTVYSVTGGTANCGSATVGLSNSQNNTFSYQLILNGSSQGGAINGSNGAFNFGTQSSAGTYTVVATSSGGCSATMSGNAIINTAPTIYSVTGGSVCGSTTVGLSNSQNNTFSYQLKLNGVNQGSAVNGSNGAFNFGTQSAVGTYTVVATSSGGCIAAMSGNAIVNTAPTVYSVTGGTTNCGSAAVGLSNSQDNTFSYQLKLNGSNQGGAVNGSNGAFNFGTQLLAGTYTVVATSSANCTAAMSSNAVINALPTLAATPISVTENSGLAPNDGITCTGDAVTLAANVATGASPYSYLWTGGSTTNPYNISPAPATGSPAYSVTVTDNNGCTITTSITLTVNPLPTIIVTPPSGNICLNDVLPQIASGASNYTWSPSAGLDVNTGTSVNASPALSTTYTVTGTTAQGCTSNSTDVISVKTLPPVSVSPNNAVCTGGITATLAASGANTYSWAPNIDINTTTGAVVTAQISNLTFYTVTGTGINLCTASVVVPVATVATGGTIAPTASIICSGGTKLLTVTGAAGHDYQWQISSDGVNWTNIAGATNTAYTTNSSDGTTLKYYRLQANSNACWNVASTAAIVDISNPTIIVTTSNITDQTITLSWTPVGSGNYTVSWSGASAGSSSNATPPKTITGLTQGGNYSISVTQTGIAGCPASGKIASVTTLCSAPTGVTATTPTNNQMIVSWTGPVANYRVFYRPLYTANTYFTQDVTAATSATITRMGNNILPGSTTYEVYVSTKDCPTSGVIGQPSSKIYVTTPPAKACAVPIIDSVKSTCPIQIEVWMHPGSSPTGIYQIYFQRLTPTIQGVVSYQVNGNYFTVNIGSAGQTYLISAASNCGSGVYSNLYIWPGNITVKPLCSTINNLVLSNPTCHGFTASWNIDQCLSNNVSYYQIYLRLKGNVNWNSYPVTPVPPAPIGPFKLINWLGKGAIYQVFIQSVYSCNGYNTTGPSSQILTDTTLSAGCKDDDQEVAPDHPTVQQYSQDKSEVLNIYPNPNNGEFMLDISRLSDNEDKVRVEVMNMLGQTVMTDLTGISGAHLSEFIRMPQTTASGNYFVRVTVGNNVYTTKINISR